MIGIDPSKDQVLDPRTLAGSYMTHDLFVLHR